MVVPSENIKLFVFDGKYLIMSFELTSVEDLMNLTNIYAVFFQVYSIDGGWGTKQSDGHFNGIVGFKILKYRYKISFHKN